MNFGNIEISGANLLTAIGGLIFLLFAIIGIMKYYFKNYTPEANSNKDSIAHKNKYPYLNAFQLSGTFFNVGLIFALSFAFLAFNWTKYETSINPTFKMEALDPEILIAPPPTFIKPPPPPPPTPKFIEVPEEPDLPPVEFVDLSIDVDTEVIAPEPIPKAPMPPPSPPPLPEEPEDTGPVIIAEVMPMFPGCSADLDKFARKACADKEMLSFIYSNINYPVMARETGIEGMVVIRFIVEKDGSISNPKIVRDIGGGCGKEAKRIVESMPKWSPGRQNGRPVRVFFNLPVKYSLQ